MCIQNPDSGLESGDKFEIRIQIQNPSELCVKEQNLSIQIHQELDSVSRTNDSKSNSKSEKPDSGSDSGICFVFISISVTDGTDGVFCLLLLQACADSFDFRENQCSAYNEFGETEKTWKPYYHPEEPCALYCVDQNNNVEVLAPKVQDGTRCRPGSLDMCIDGRCQVNYF